MADVPRQFNRGTMDIITCIIRFTGACVLGAASCIRYVCIRYACIRYEETLRELDELEYEMDGSWLKYLGVVDPYIICLEDAESFMMLSTDQKLKLISQYPTPPTTRTRSKTR